MENKVVGVEEASRDTISSAKRGTGYQATQEPHEYFNQSIAELRADWIIGTLTQVTNNEANTYWDNATTTFKKKDTTTATFLDGDKILWRGLDTLTADIDISTIDDLEHIMFQGVTIALGIYDLDLGENQRGELDLSGTGTLDILSSDRLRIKNSGLTIENNNGDIFIDNFRPSEKSANIEYKNLVAKYVTTDTVDVDIDSLKLIDSDNNTIIINNIDETLDIGSDIHAGTVKTETWYEIWISAKPDGTIGKKLVPDLTGITDSTTAGKLEDSTADFVTDAIQIGDIVYNTTDKTKTKVTAIDDLNTLSLADDIFVSGENYTIHILSPTLDADHTFKANIGAVYNNSGSDFDWFNREDDVTALVQISITAGVSGDTTIDLSSIIPITAKRVHLEITGKSTLSASGNIFSRLTIYADSGRSKNSIAGQQHLFTSATMSALRGTHSDWLVLTEKQTAYARAEGDGTRNSNATCTGYEI